jgi:lambda family phage portal protein
MNQNGVRFGANGNGSCGSGSYRDSAYAGASRTRKQLSNWQPIRQPADSELLPSYDLLVARSRDLDRNNGVASGAFQSLQDNTVGIGLRLSASPDYRALGRDIGWAEDWSRQVESLWATWANTTACDVAGKMTFATMTQVVFRLSLQCGEALALPLWLERGDTPFRTCLQLVETDRLSNPNFVPSSLNLRGGIEMDDYGRPLAYHVMKQMNWPGYDMWTYGLGYGSWLGFGVTEWERIPAETPSGRKRVIHVFGQDRVDQTRGKPILTPIIEQFRMLDSYQRTELQSSIVNSLVAGVIETPMDPAGIAEMMGGDPNAYLQTKGEYRVQLEGGTFIPLYPGDKMTPFVPARPAPQFSNFCETVLRQIGTALGMPYELVLKDFSKTNYSSARAALLEAWRFFINRRTWLSTYWAGPIYKLWLEEAVNAGMVDAPDFYNNMPFYLKAKWIGPGRGWIDPVKEAQAAQIRMDSLVSTLEVECAEQGLDWNDVLEQRALEMERMKQLNLVPPLTPAPPRGEQAAPDTAEEPSQGQPQPGKEAA